MNRTKKNTNRTTGRTLRRFVGAGALALMVAAAAVLPVAGSAYAYETSAYAPTGQPSAADTSTIRIYGVGQGAAVRAYHIVGATYNAYGLTGYYQLEAAAKVSAITKNTDARGTILYDNPTYANIAALAQAIHTNANGIKSELEPIDLVWDAAEEAYVTDQAKAGSYLVLVEHESEGYIYNPMWVSNDYTDAILADSLGTDDGNGSVTAELDTVVKLDDQEAYAKKSSIYLTKDIVDPSTGNTKVDDERVGDTVMFDVKTVTPDYSDGFKVEDITFTITDVQSAGLAVVDPANIHVYIGDAETGAELSADNYNKAVNAGNNTWTVDFAPKWVRENPNTEITIRYSTVIDEDAVMAANSNPNTATLTYTTVYGETDTISDRTRHYTYELHAIKTDADGAALANATFELTQLSEGNAYGAGALPTDSVVYTAVSDAEGRLNFTGLEEGTYLLWEIKAPKGYTLHDSTWTITITPTYDAATNILSKYIVSITENYVDGTTGTTYSYSYTVASHEDAEDGLADVVEIVEEAKEDAAIVSIPNTKLSKLPSVGSVGTAGLAVAAVALVGGALTLVVIAKRRDRKDEAAQSESGVKA